MGSRLKEARQQAGLSLDDIASKLKIRAGYLSAIEEGRHEAIPGNVYAQGYLKMYANHLGLNLSELSQVSAPNNNGFWTKPERMAQYGTYKVALSLSLIGIFCIFCWHSLEEYDQEHNLINRLGQYSEEEASGIPYVNIIDTVIQNKGISDE